MFPPKVVGCSHLKKHKTSKYFNNPQLSVIMT